MAFPGGAARTVSAMTRAGAAFFPFFCYVTRLLRFEQKISMTERLLLRVFAALALVSLAACKTVPITYPDVVAPQAAAITPVRHTGRPVVALVLGGGRERGYAHVGVIKALEEEGIRVDMVVGTSVGSLIGSLYAGGMSPVDLRQLALQLDESDVEDYKISRSGYVSGLLLQDFVNRALKNRSIEELNKPFAAVAVSLSDGRSVVFNRGNTGMAVRASSSIPGVFQPVNIEGATYVDGGVRHPVPVGVARQMGADIVIAVDISRKPQEAETPTSILNIMLQSLRIMQQAVIEREIGDAQIIIHPKLGDTGEVDFATKLRLIEAGEQAARAAIPQIRELQRKLSQTETRELAAP